MNYWQIIAVLELKQSWGRKGRKRTRRLQHRERRWGMHSSFIAVHFTSSGTAASACIAAYSPKFSCSVYPNYHFKWLFNLAIAERPTLNHPAVKRPREHCFTFKQLQSLRRLPVLICSYFPNFLHHTVSETVSVLVAAVNVALLKRDVTGWWYSPVARITPCFFSFVSYKIIVVDRGWNLTCGNMKWVRLQLG